MNTMKRLTKHIIVLSITILTLYHPSFAQWETLQTETKAQKRHENAFAKVGDKFYLIGGRGVKPIDIYDPKTKTWSQGAIPPVEMSHFQAVSYQGMLYVMGGLRGGWPFETPLTHIYIYNPTVDRWLVGPEIPPHRQRGATGVVVYQDKIYMVCGIVNGHTSGWVSWLDEYDPATNSWRQLPNAPRSRDHLQAAVLDDQLVVTGGRKSGYEGKGFEATIAETDVFDFRTGTWRTLPESGNIPTQRAGCTAVVVGDEVIVIGGESGSQQKAHAEVEALSLKNNSWRSLPNLVTGRHGTQVVLSEGNLYIASGCGNRGGSPELDLLESYTLEKAVVENDEAIIPGSLNLSTTAHHFGKVRPFDRKSTTISLRNDLGNQGIPLTFLIVAGDDAFELDFPYPLPYVLPPGKSVEMKVSFSPEDMEAAKASLFIKTSDTGRERPREIKLEGN